MIKIKITILYILIFGCFRLNAGSVVLIKGSLTEGTSKHPVGTKIFFLDKKGKKTYCNSNSLDGSYQQVLASGEIYKVLFQDYFLVEGEKEIIIPESKEYQEITKNFSAQKIYEGLELLSIKVFEPNDSNLSESSKESFMLLKEMMQINPRVHIAINISSADSWYEPFKKKSEVYQSKKSKKKTFKSVTISTEEQLKELVDSRIRMVQEYLSSIGVRDTRVTYLQDIKINKLLKSKSKKSKSSNLNFENVKVKISKIMNL